MEIKPVRREDLSRCAQLYAEVFSSPPYQEDWTYEKALARLQEFWEDCGGSCFVAEERGRVVGFAFCSYHTWWCGKVMRIEELGVDFRLQRHGIGTMLLEHCLAAGREAHGIAAAEVVTPRTVPALEFYGTHGFHSAGRELLSRRL
ncbi:MAG: GNAT family N-acetyltransferase [Chloroflexota bacterium]